MSEWVFDACALGFELRLVQGPPQYPPDQRRTAMAVGHPSLPPSRAQWWGNYRGPLVVFHVRSSSAVIRRRSCLVNFRRTATGPAHWENRSPQAARLRNSKYTLLHPQTPRPTIIRMPSRFVRGFPFSPEARKV